MRRAGFPRYTTVAGPAGGVGVAAGGCVGGTVVGVGATGVAVAGTVAEAVAAGDVAVAAGLTVAAGVVGVGFGPPPAHAARASAKAAICAHRAATRRQSRAIFASTTAASGTQRPAGTA
jgi:hypothetical protein